MNSIFSKQNDDLHIRLLRSFNEVYIIAKRMTILLFATSVVVPISTNILFIFFSDKTFRSIFCFINLFMILVSFVLKELIDRYREIGSLLQQWYDYSLFDIDELTPFEKSKVEKYAIKYGDKKMENEMNWYLESDASDANPDYLMVLCHKRNVSWTSRITGRYLVFMVALFFAVLLPTIFGLVLTESDIGSVFQFLYNLAPALTYVFFSIYLLVKEKIKFVRIRDFIDVLFADSKQGKDIHKHLYELQEMVYEYRRNKRLVPGLVYKVFYKKDSDYENKASKSHLC